MKNAIYMMVGLLLLWPVLAQAASSGLDTTGGPQYFGIGGQQVGVWTTDGLTVNGSMQVGQTNTTCGPATAGAMRWNPAGYMEVCNGSVWGKLGGTAHLITVIDAASSSSTSPSTVNSGAAYDFCALSKVNVQDNGSHMHTNCQVTPHGDGSWDLNASLTVGYVQCSMDCFNIY